MASQQEQDVAAAPQPAFTNLDAEAEPVVVDSLCMNCHEQGTTRILLTRIPHFKEIVIMAFECPHCNYRNNEVQSAREIGERGVLVVCSVTNSKDLNRQLVKSEFATLRIPAVDLEVPPTSDRGSLNTIEGTIAEVVTNLEASQEDRKAADADAFVKVAQFIAKLRGLLDVPEPFDVVIDDPSGNSYIESLHVGTSDPQLNVRHYVRSAEQDRALGLNQSAMPIQATDIGEDGKEVYQFATICSNCSAPAVCNMKMIDIPFFKEVIIMATACDSCGFKTNEVKSGGAIPDKGKRITLKLTDADDLSRDVLKSDSCKMTIPEIGLELRAGTLGSRFTTLEALLDQVADQLTENPFLAGDSHASREELDAFVSKLRAISKGERTDVTIIFDDALGASYVQNVYAPDPDPNMTIEEYERTFEDNEEWGLNDMKTTDYEEDTQEEGKTDKANEAEAADK